MQTSPLTPAPRFDIVGRLDRVAVMPSSSKSSNIAKPGRIRGNRRASERFIISIGRALHGAGAPAHQLEEAMERMSVALGLVGHFFSTPTAIFASFGNNDGRSTRLERVQPGDTALERLNQLDTIIERVLDGQQSPSQALRALAQVTSAPRRWPVAAETVSFALVAAAASRFFGGGWPEIATAAVLGLVTGLIAYGAGRWPAAGRLLYPLAGLTASLLAGLAHAVYGPVSIYVVTLAALIPLVPGMTLTVAMTELATRHLVSGSARLAGAMLVFVTLGFGVGLGNRLTSLWLDVGEIPAPTAAPAWTEWAALLLVSVALTVQFRAHPRDIGWVLAASVLAVHSGRAGSVLLGPEIGAFLGAVLVGVAANLVARFARRPAAMVQLPGLMLLVPGSIGFRSMASLVAHDTLSGVQAAFTMTLVAIALVTGLLVANVVLPPRRLT